MTPFRPSRNSFHSILQNVSTAPVGTPSERVKLRPRLCAALNMAKYARNMNDDPSIRKTWSPFFSLRGATALDMGPAYVWRGPRHTTPWPVRKASLGVRPDWPEAGMRDCPKQWALGPQVPQVLVDYLARHDSKGPRFGSRSIRGRLFASHSSLEVSGFQRLQHGRLRGQNSWQPTHHRRVCPSLPLPGKPGGVGGGMV